MSYDATVYTIGVVLNSSSRHTRPRSTLSSTALSVISIKASKVAKIIQKNVKACARGSGVDCGWPD